MNIFRKLSKRVMLIGKPLLMYFAVIAVVISATIGLSVVTKKVVVIDGESSKTIYTLSSEPSSILDQAGIILSHADGYSFTGIKSGWGEITLRRAFTVSVTINGEAYNILTCDATVGDILSATGEQVNSEDYINYSRDCSVTPGMNISVLGVNYTTRTETYPVGYETKVTYSDSLYEGQTKVTPGELGEMMVTFSQRIIGGEVVEASVVDQAVVKEAVAEQKIIGTKKNVATVTNKQIETAATAATPKASSAYTYLSSGLNYVSALAPSSDFELDANGIPVNYTKVIKGSASAYTATGNRTSTGKVAQAGYIAVNPSQIPYGTKLFIRSSDGSYIYGYASAEDTGGFTKWGTRVADLYFNTYSECIRFGVRSVEIYVLG